MEGWITSETELLRSHLDASGIFVDEVSTLMVLRESDLVSQSTESVNVTIVENNEALILFNDIFLSYDLQSEPINSGTLKLHLFKNEDELPLADRTISSTKASFRGRTDLLKELGIRTSDA